VANHLDSIPGIGAVTAAVLTAFLLDVERCDTPGQLVAYFGVLPIEVASGVDRDGQPRGPKRYVMSRRGNDLVRRYLGMAALSAVRCNPAVRALYRRVVAKQPRRKAVAIGHGMRKLLHLVFAIWKSGRPFAATRYPWEAGSEEAPRGSDTGMSVEEATSDTPLSEESQAAGHKQTAKPARKVVTAACPDTIAESEAPSQPGAIDVAHLKGQLPLARVLDQLGLTGRLRGSGAQRRCTCPLHRGDARGRTFSVNLQENVFQCFDARCAKKGDVIDLWAAVRGLSLRQAAEDLVPTFQLEATPRRGTEKRNG
jgi:hypothetical protein